jgi:hypothetical protein
MRNRWLMPLSLMKDLVECEFLVLIKKTIISKKDISIENVIRYGQHSLRYLQFVSQKLLVKVLLSK